MSNQNEQNLTPKRPKPVVLIILDGWGIAPNSVGNAISQAKTPNFDKYCQEYFCAALQASGEAVGLLFNEMGNSEVGHLNLGAGRIIYQNLPKINKSITDKSFFSNPIFLNACKNVNQKSSALHLIGLLSTGGVHASVNHLYALLELAKQQKVKNVFAHVILDGRDMDYNSGLGLVSELLQKIKNLGIGNIASVCGRWWAMDRDNRWGRIEKAYNAMVNGESKNKSINPIEAIKKSYAQKIYDEEFYPTVIINNDSQPIAKIQNSDSVIFANYRADRGRQLSKAFVLPSFDKFERGAYLKDLYFATMTQYDKDLPIEVAYPPETIKNSLAEILSKNNLKQLHIAETEKYAHVTYFFNGGVEEKFSGEEHVLIPSPAVENYAQTPKMSALKIKDNVLKELSANKYDFIVINFANPDMIAHTGDLSASIKALEFIDECLGEISEAVLSLNGVCLITADHGNAEEIINPQSGEINKEHSITPVPFILIDKKHENSERLGEGIKLELLTPSGVLADVAPTILKIMNIEQPEEMAGRSLI
ncbi:2,3-bisphosphoglycerate-independent phosphoglycerate mutase [Candidatus Parcubacteria bacterium]|nr:2,3-bisphosphoglycerate-independent phosphoglycerate mutase [Patescibacteria group bacterium]MBU4482055.1 2,3-bisphosphoglycerate-independent phosphoglycerate mutase [Patescibacteria group bacterium]MCG2687119.1 2,3-bisphosphoglycerate-independent phosphoglycerate mutase [Candidatus Parcubacteria bacterium]